MSNPIWLHFERKESSAICNVCKMNISLGSKHKSKQTAQSLWRHLERHHATIHAECQKFKLTSKATSLKRQSEQPLIQATLESLPVQKWTSNHPRSSEIDDLIMNMIVVDCLPFSFTEKVGFKELMNKVAPKYEMKKSKFFRERLDAKYQVKKNEIQVEISKFRHLSFTTDIWTSSSGLILLIQVFI